MDDAGIAAVVNDPHRLAHRYDPGHDAIHFVTASRETHRRATFLIDEYLPDAKQPLVLTRQAAMSQIGSTDAPLHFIFHSAFCGSTLLARAFDRQGLAMGLKEPVILNDLIGWRRRAAPADRLDAVMRDALRLMARPFAPGEAIVVKPSNIVNSLASTMMRFRPEARAILLHAPLRTFLTSVAKKGLEGRIWVRGLFAGLRQDGMVALGFDDAAYFGQTDLQIAAMGWLGQHAAFHALIREFGPTRIRTLDSQALFTEPEMAIARTLTLFGLSGDDTLAQEIASGPAFGSHSKTHTPYDAAARSSEYDQALRRHGDEIGKVAIWAEQVARHNGIGLTLDAPLFV